MFFNLCNQLLLHSKKSIINDKNYELINAYKLIQNNPQALLENLQALQEKHNEELFYTIRRLDRDVGFKDRDPAFRAARFIYLNKTCFNGLCRYNARGEFNTPMGSYKNPKIYDRALIMNASRALQGVRILCADFAKALRTAARGDFVYFDPPYHPLNKTSSFVSYTDNFVEKDQMRLFEVFKDLDCKGVKVLQSNSNTGFIQNLYKDFESIELKAKRVINCKGSKRGEITELLIKGHYE